MAVLLLGATTVLGAGLQQRSAATLAAGLNENWRGAYDLLVTPADRAPDACLSEAGARVAPNFVSGTAGMGGLTLSELDQIRTVGGVEVAAPIGLVGQIGTPARGLVLSAGVPDELTAAQVEADVVLDDGAQRLPVSTFRTRLVYGTDVFHLVGAQGLVAETAEGQELVGTDAFIGAFPPTAQSIIAVDPEAEAELLGGQGDFLDPLRMMGTFGSDRSLARLSPLEEWAELFQEDSVVGDAGPDSVGIPLVVNTDPQFRFEADITALELDLSGVEAMWQEPPYEGDFEMWEATPELVAALGEVAAGELLEEQRQDFGAELVPLALRPLAVEPSWLPPNDFPPPSEVGGGDIQRVVPQEVSFVQRGVVEGECRMEAVPAGGPERISWLLPGQNPLIEYEAGSTGFTVQNYREVAEVLPGLAGLFPQIVGYYSSGSVDVGVDEVSYVPLGAYEVGQTLIAGADGTVPAQEDGATLAPPVNGMGVTAASAGAITDLQGGRDLVGRDAIDAVRVRVAGLSGYDEAGRARVARVADELLDLGFSVHVVAGSSREQTPIWVPDYFVDDRAERTGDLGWVFQEWSSLGAAERVESGHGRGALTLLLLALGSTAVLTVTVLSFVGVARRREVAVLRTQGWETSHVRSWLVGELVVGAAVLTVLCAVAWGWQVFTGGDVRVLVLAVVCVLVAYAVGAVLMVALAMGSARPLRRPRRSSSLTLGIGGVLRRLVSVAPAAMAVSVVGLIVASLSLAGVVVAVQVAAALAGQSRLGQLMTGTLLPLYLALATVGLLAALTMVWTGRRVLSRARARVTHTLTVAGWSPRQVRSLWDREAVVVGVVTLLAATLMTLLLARSAQVEPTWPAAAAAIGAVVLTLASLAGHRKETT